MKNAVRFSQAPQTIALIVQHVWEAYYVYYVQLTMKTIANAKYSKVMPFAHNSSLHAKTNK